MQLANLGLPENGGRNGVLVLEEIFFAKQIHVTTSTQIARNQSRLPEKGFHPSKLNTAEIQVCKCAKICRKEISDGHKIQNTDEPS